MKGLSTILDHKKWVFAYFSTFIVTTLVNLDKIDGAQFTASFLLILAGTIGASSFDKSKWAKDD